jgi:DNA replication protein DnaC
LPLSDPDFGMAVPCQCTLTSFQQDRIALLRRVSGLQSLNHLTFATLDPAGRSPEITQRSRYTRAVEVARAYAEEPEGWLAISGASGSGKTHLAVAIAQLCIEADKQALYISAPDLLDHLRAAFAPQSEVGYDELFEHVRSVPLLVLDDLGVHSTTPWAQEKLFQILNQRFLTRLPTVVAFALTYE